MAEKKQKKEAFSESNKLPGKKSKSTVSNSSENKSKGGAGNRKLGKNAPRGNSGGGRGGNDSGGNRGGNFGGGNK